MSGVLIGVLAGPDGGRTHRSTRDRSIRERQI